MSSVFKAIAKPFTKLGPIGTVVATAAAAATGNFALAAQIATAGTAVTTAASSIVNRGGTVPNSALTPVENRANDQERAQSEDQARRRARQAAATGFQSSVFTSRSGALTQSANLALRTSIGV